MSGHTASVNKLCFTAQEHRLITASDDHRVKVCYLNLLYFYGGSLIIRMFPKGSIVQKFWGGGLLYTSTDVDSISSFPVI